MSEFDKKPDTKKILLVLLYIVCICSTLLCFSPVFAGFPLAWLVAKYYIWILGLMVASVITAVIEAFVSSGSVTTIALESMNDLPATPNPSALNFKERKKATWNKEFRYIYDDVEICVFHCRQPDFSKLEIGESLNLIPEPDNEYDPNAVALYGNQGFVGYMYRDRLQNMVNDFIDRKDCVEASIVRFNVDEKKIYVELRFGYRIPPEFESFKLVGNTNDEMQDNISICDEDDLITVEYDSNKEKYLVCSCSLDIGYLPEVAEQHLEECEDDEKVGIISSIEVNDKDKYVVTVDIKV